jgi:Zn finger protein HypA/HybF involved in hydrogenase expression
MHEYGVAKSIIDIIERRGTSTPPSRVKVILNPMYGISAETLAGTLEIAKMGSKLEGTEFNVVLFDSKFTCTKCGKEFASGDMIWGIGCDDCGSFELKPSKDLASFGLARVETGEANRENLRVEGEAHHGDGAIHY